MTNKRIVRMLVSAMLAVSMLLSGVISVCAEESAQSQIPETTAPQTESEPAVTTSPTVPETEPSDTTAPTVLETEPPEITTPTVPETEPPMTTTPTVPETEPPATTAPTVPETEPPETTAPTIPETQPPETTEPTAPEEETGISAQTILYATIAEARAMEPSTQLITLRGTVVYALGNQAVLQDSTGGIRLSFGEDPDVELGDELEVTGMRSGGFYVTDFVWEGTATLPAVETTLYDAEENLRVRIRNAGISGNTLSQNGTTIDLIGTVPASAEGTKVDVYGVILDGWFYFDSIVPAATSAETTMDTQESWNFYFGQLHAHTDLSDGLGSVAEAFSYASMVEGLDFFAVTDHSNSFDNADEGSITQDGCEISDEWAEGKAAAAAVTDEKFVGIFGYEMTWKDITSNGHISTFNTFGWQSRTQSEFDTLESYYKALTKAPDSISQFNHPSNSANFDYFSHYSPEFDQVIQLLEVNGKEEAMELYHWALDAGWHLAPTNNQNNHARQWGDESDVRTVVLAESLKEESLFAAIRKYRVYATEDKDLKIEYRLNGSLMGSIIGTADRLIASVSLEDATDTLVGTVVEVIVDGGDVADAKVVEKMPAELYIQLPGNYSYYYLKITQPDGDVAVTAPVWTDTYEQIGVHSLTSDVTEPLEGQEVLLTLKIYNEETVDYLLEKIEFSVNGSPVGEITKPVAVGAMTTRAYDRSFVCAAPGELAVAATVTGTVAGQSRTYKETLILRCQSKESPITSTIAQARAGTPGTTFRVKGYVTAGNENPYNTFPKTLYLQDDTGGIAVTGTLSEEVKVGDHMIVSGVLLEQSGNLVLELTGYELTGEIPYRYVPETMSNSLAMNYGLHGGKLLQIEGEVVSLTKTVDGSGISRFTLKDSRGTLATVIIEDYIRSGAHGTNELASKVRKGRTVRAMGLLHVDEYGQTVLRVRNCDEVVYVPPTSDPSNPKTGDRFWFWK